VPPSYLEPGRSRRRRGRRRSTFASRGRRRRRRGSRLPTPSLTSIVVAVAALLGVGAGVLIIRATRGDDGRATVERFARAWERGDYAAMYRLVDPRARRSVSRLAFEDAYRQTARTATATGVQVGLPRREDDDWSVPVRVSTRVFGTVAGRVRMRLSDDSPAGVVWTRALTFPGMTATGRLVRRTRAPRRAALLARGGRPLADSEGVQTELGGSLGLVGELGLAEGARLRRLTAAGFPADVEVGVSGLQRALDDRLRGRPGGTLSVGRRVLVRTQPVPAAPVRASIDPSVQSAAQEALAGRFGGIAAIEPSTGEVLALSGIALDGAQPPGSTFKIMTLTAALEERLVTPRSRFPVQTGASVGGYYIANAHDEACGGDLAESFSKSCNSVFGPLGVKLGARRLVDVAERFGFNRPVEIPGAKPDTIPRASAMTGPAEVGSSAIGQGRVLATALGMARVGATIATLGKRPRLTLVHGETPRLEPATTAPVARIVRDMMVEVVNGDGATGTEAAIRGGRVAGKTGTAELGGDQENDAWFVAFAPAPKPKLAVAVLVVHGGFGGETAAPIAREVLRAGLEVGG
jgi:cell division protein FtsI/penicillin-binding protein 2